jgi:branched-chain amino acid transport system ATP-binding protein
MAALAPGHNREAGAMTEALRIENLDMCFGGLHVTRRVSLSLRPGDRLALIGPNGAGKTTLVNLISGVLAPSAGHVWLGGRDVTRHSQAQRVRAGLARTFQITTLAPHLPVQRQVELALFEREGLTGRAWRSIDAYPVLAAEARSLLATLGLGEHAGLATERLAYGEQRLVEMSLALALRPKVLLLDEPMAGVPKGDGERLLAALAGLPPELAVLIIEHDMDLVFRVARRIVVLTDGAVLADGTPDQIRRDPKVRAAYLGD